MEQAIHTIQIPVLTQLATKTFNILHLHTTPRRSSPQKKDVSHISRERDLQLTLTDENWDDIYEYAHKGSLNVEIQENGYKITTKWYRTPARLHKFSPTIPNICWRCKKAKGSMLHIWWACTHLQPFWREVHTLITQIPTYTLDNISFTSRLYLSRSVTNCLLCTWSMLPDSAFLFIGDQQIYHQSGNG